MSQYDSLKTHLECQTSASISMSYGEIERVLKRPLPVSARGATKRQWWANTDTHSQAKAWLAAGRKARLDVEKEIVTFYRSESPAAMSGAEIRFQVEALSPVARRLITSLAEETGSSEAEAVLALINEAALRRRQDALDWFAKHTVQSPQTSAELIRADRDER